MPQYEEDAPRARIVLPAFRAWNVEWWDGNDDHREEIVIGHLISFPHPQMLAVMEIEVVQDEWGKPTSKAMVRRVIVANHMSFDECPVPVMEGSGEMH